MTEPAVDTTWIDAQIGYLLRRASTAMAADYASSGGTDRLRPVLVSMLGLIDANPGIGQSALGATLGIHPANVTPLVTDLIGRGLVERRPSPSDGRRVELRLTSEGEARFRTGRRLIDGHEARMTAALTDADRAALRDLLTRIIDATHDHRPPTNHRGGEHSG